MIIYPDTNLLIKHLHCIGVKTEAEKKSFAFDSMKGFEPIIFDFFDPNTLLAVVYRIKQIRFDLDRQFMGSVINLAGTVILSFLMIVPHFS